MGRFCLTKRPSPALVVSFVALIVALGGTSYAAFSLPKNSVGTKQLKNGAVTTNKIRNGTVTKAKINTSGLTVPNALQANSATTAGSASNAGHATNSDQLGGVPASGYQRGVRWALVAADGSSILAQSGGISIEHHITGGYYLNFGSSVVGHAFAVQVQDSGFPAFGSTIAPCGGASAGPGAITCASGTNTANDAFVTTTNGSGTQTDKEFYVTVF
jgi:hypothetical protein